MGKYPVVVALTVVTLAVLATLVWHDPKVESNNQQLDAGQVASDHHGQTILDYPSKYGALPDSLEGTVMKQALMVDESGHLIVTPDLKRIFNFFLSANQEESIEVILLRIQEYLDFYLDGAALAQATDILQGYVAYKKALMEFEQEQSAQLANGEASSMYGLSRLETMEDIILKRRALRSQFLDAQTADAFYAREDIYDDYMISKLKINARTDLTEAEKQTRLDELNNAADPEWVASRKRATMASDLRARTNELQQQGGSSEEIRQARIEMAGVDAANRLEQLDQERAIWHDRINDYLKAREHILNQDGVSEEAKEEQIQSLRSDQFSAREQIRLRAYERQALL